jgi:hypothetical protein
LLLRPVYEKLRELRAALVNAKAKKAGRGS